MAITFLSVVSAMTFSAPRRVVVGVVAVRGALPSLGWASVYVGPFGGGSAAVDAFMVCSAS